MSSFKIEDIPIFWREKRKINKAPGIPNIAPAHLILDQKFGFIKQKYDPTISKILNKIYSQEENIGYLQDDNPLSKLYGTEFLNFITDNSNSNSSICEIGCGGCFTLKELQRLNYEVFGIDPSPISKEIGNNQHIEIINEFFPSKKIKRKFDYIIHYDVLEHIWEPFEFLCDISNSLTTNGKTIFVIPDSTDQINNGDISLFLHQHINYFTLSSISCLLYACGFNEINIKRSKITGTLLCVASKSNPTTNSISESDLKKAIDESLIFFCSVEYNMKRIQAKVDEITEKNNIGLYPPLRAIPYLSKIIIKKPERFFFIDDNPKVNDCYICDIPIPIKPIKETLKEKVNHFLVASHTFKQIMTKNIKSVKSDAKIIYL